MMWLYSKHKLFNLDKVDQIQVSKNTSTTGVYIVKDEEHYRIYDSSKEECQKYLNLLAMHMSTNPTIINHEDVVKGLGVE